MRTPSPALEAFLDSTVPASGIVGSFRSRSVSLYREWAGPTSGLLRRGLGLLRRGAARMRRATAPGHRTMGAERGRGGGRERASRRGWIARARKSSGERAARRARSLSDWRGGARLGAWTGRGGPSGIAGACGDAREAVAII